MTKYNQLFKQQVVNFYFEHHENLAFTFLEKGIVWIMRQWKVFWTNENGVFSRKIIY